MHEAGSHRTWHQGGYVQRHTKVVTAVVALGVSAVALGACQSPAAVHAPAVVQAGAGALPQGRTTAVSPGSGDPSASQGLPGTAPAGSSALDSTAVTDDIDQFTSDLSGLDATLAQVGSDIDNPQGDS